jgi:3'-5' exoribonuclease
MTTTQSPQSPQTPQRPPHTDLRTLKPNGYVDGVYGIINPQIGTTKAGKPYLKCLLRDASSEVPARQWTFDEATFNDLCSTGFVFIAGHTQVYNGQCQIILEQIRAVEVSDEEIAALLPSTSKDINEMFAEVKSLLATLEHPAMKALAQAYLDDDELMERFRRAPAAVTLHHAWIGGLLEHTLQLMKLADIMLPLYPQLNRDIVMMGVFLHDLGKTLELTWERGFNYTADGNLIGHIVRGAIVLQIKAAVAGKSGQKLPTAALRVLQHIILSHHGAAEFGAAKLPSTPEAVFVSQLDNLDAKTSMALNHARPEGAPPIEGAADFTDKVWALQTRLYCPDPLANEEL